MSDGADYLKYVMKRVVTYWEQPQETLEVRRQRRRKREPWVSRWFGQLLPVGIVVWWHLRRENSTTEINRKKDRVASTFQVE